MYLVLAESKQSWKPWDIETVVFGETIAKHFLRKGFRVLKITGCEDMAEGEDE